MKPLLPFSRQKISPAGKHGAAYKVRGYTTNDGGDGSQKGQGNGGRFWQNIDKDGGETDENKTDCSKKQNRGALRVSTSTSKVN
jgi:hypothetical protein